MKIGVIGCGNMGTAFVRYLAKKHDCLLCDRKKETVTKIAQELGAQATTDMLEVARTCDVVLLAVKPKDFEGLAKTIGEELQKEALVISMLAGISYETLKRHFPTARPLRIMPNLPVRSGGGVIGVENDPEFTEPFRQEITTLFSDLGSTYFVSEKELDALVALSGGGPAFFCVFLEGLIESGIQLGFKPAIAREIAEKTVAGTISFLQEEEVSTQQYRWMNCSPGGTTIEGIQVLEDAGIRGVVMEACKAAYEKAFLLH